MFSARIQFFRMEICTKVIFPLPSILEQPMKFPRLPALKPLRALTGRVFGRYNFTQGRATGPP